MKPLPSIPTLPPQFLEPEETHDERKEERRLFGAPFIESSLHEGSSKHPLLEEFGSHCVINVAAMFVYTSLESKLEAVV